MRIGFDIDGVLADFVAAYRPLLIKMTGVNHFVGKAYWNSWFWDIECGYTKEQQAAAFKWIAESRSFWYSLLPTEDCNTLSMCIQSLEHENDVYFITNRGGQYAKRQTEAWLSKYLPYPHGDVSPTVLITSDKAAAAKALKLDAYIDDNYDNIKSVVEHSPKTRAYLLNQPWNKGKDMVSVLVQGTEGGIPTLVHEERPIIRIYSLADMLDIELQLV